MAFEKPFIITRAQLRKAALDGLERLATAHGIGLPHMPRHWSGYRRALIKRVEGVVGATPEREIWRKS